MTKAAPTGPFLRTPIRRVRRTAAALALTALVAVPAGSVLLSEEPPAVATQTEALGPSDRASAAPKVLEPPAKAKVRPAEDARARVGYLISQETPALVALAAREPRDRLAILNVLWGRGAEAEAEALVETDPSLAIKLAALRARRVK